VVAIALELAAALHVNLTTVNCTLHNRQMIIPNNSLLKVLVDSEEVPVESEEVVVVDWEDTWRCLLSRIVRST